MKILSATPIILVSLFFLIYPNISFSEPWLSNRFAQNCASCHAPGRVNLPAKKRRCTLSCQGCHVNPNGGGLRSDYGKWTQQRWLKTFHIKGNKLSKKAPAPDFAQRYMKKSKTLKYAKKSKSKRKKKNRRKKKARRNRKGKIAKMYSTTALDHNEKYYDQYSNTDWKKIYATSLKQFLTRVPVGDPWRTERKNVLSAGGDFRYLFGSSTDNNIDSAIGSRDFNLLMSADFGIRMKPVKEHFSVVYEGRFFGIPGQDTGFLEPMNRPGQIRSAYMFSDNLPYNTWVMAGRYRPNFGYYTADHTSISSSITGMNQDSSYNAIGFGGSPNVPFFDAHYIFKKSSETGDEMKAGNFTGNFAKESGFNVNFGARAVTLGLSGKVSYWNTKLDTGEQRELIAVSGGAAWKRLIGNFQFLRWSVLTPTESAGNTTTIDLKYRVWRENYLTTNFSSANTGDEGHAGRAQEYSLGLKSYLMSGLKLELIYKNKVSETSRDSVPDKDITTYFMQIHSYF